MASHPLAPVMFSMVIENKQGRIHGRISHVRLGRSGDAKTAQKTLTKQMHYRQTNQPTNQRTDTVGYRVACSRLETIYPQFFEFASPATLAMMAKKINNSCTRTGPHERLVPMRGLVKGG